MTTKHAMTAQQFNQQQHMQLRGDSFKTAGTRVYLFEGATVLVDEATKTITAVNRVPGKTFEPIIAIRRIAYYLGYVNYEGERHELEILKPETSAYGWLFGQAMRLFPKSRFH